MDRLDRLDDLEQSSVSLLEHSVLLTNLSWVDRRWLDNLAHDGIWVGAFTVLQSYQDQQDHHAILLAKSSGYSLTAWADRFLPYLEGFFGPGYVHRLASPSPALRKFQ